MTPLSDRFGRIHTYLRVSVTDRCNFRCVYCMPHEGMQVMPRDELLTYEEITRLVRIFAGMGITRVRLTGGEPLVRRDLEQLVESLGAIEGLTDLAMTTNAYRLSPIAERLASAGLNRLNVSIDSLDPVRFKALTRGGDLARVLDGIQAARDAGITPIKLNIVLLEGQNDDELPVFLDYFGRQPEHFVLRFIEYMPFDERWHQSVPGRRLRAALRDQWTLEPYGGERLGDGPAAYWRIRENGLRVGFISPLSEKFCSACNRLRLMANGHLRTCLSDDGTPSLRDLLRAGLSDAQVETAVRAMVANKREGHSALLEGGTPFEGVMTRVGG